MPVRQIAVRQNVFRQNVFQQNVFRQNVRPPSNGWLRISRLIQGSWYSSVIDSDVTSAYNQQVSFVDSTVNNEEHTKGEVHTLSYI